MNNMELKALAIAVIVVSCILACWILHLWSSKKEKAVTATASKKQSWFIKNPTISFVLASWALSSFTVMIIGNELYGDWYLFFPNSVYYAFFLSGMASLLSLMFKATNDDHIVGKFKIWKGGG